MEQPRFFYAENHRLPESKQQNSVGNRIGDRDMRRQCATLERDQRQCFASLRTLAIFLMSEPFHTPHKAEVSRVM